MRTIGVFLLCLGAFLAVSFPACAVEKAALDVADDATTVALPGAAENVTVGGGGKYLVFWLKRLQKLAVVDLEAGAIAGYVPVASDEVVMAAGQEKLLVGLGESAVLQRWDLKTLEKELTARLDQAPRSVAMGWASQGPAVLDGRIVVDVSRMRGVCIQDRIKGGGTLGLGKYEVRASGDGSILAAWRTSTSPSGVFVAHVASSSLEWSYEHQSAGALLPTADGGVILSSSGSAFTPELKRLASESLRGMECVPAYGGCCFLGIRGRGMGRGANELQAGLYSLNGWRLLTPLPRLKEMEPVPGAPMQRGGWAADRRYFYVPSLGVLATIPETNDKVVVRKLDLMAMLDRSGVDYLFVDSLPVRMARNGQAYRYPIAVRSKRGGVQYKLESGPGGMTLGSDGVLNWPVPRGLLDKRVGVIVSIRDGSGQELLHSFNIDLDTGTGRGQAIIISNSRD